MNKDKRRALEAAGWTIGDAEDFLELTAEERAIVELRVQLSRAIRAQREKQKLSQAKLAQRMKTSQPRVNKIEAGSSGVSLEQLMTSWYALGGTVEMKLRQPFDSPGAPESAAGHAGQSHRGKAGKAVAMPAKRPGKKAGSK